MTTPAPTTGGTHPDPRNTEAFAALHHAARPRMLLIALAIVGNRAEAEDVTQDAAVTGLNKFRAGEFTLGTNFEAWMGQITRFTALNALRYRRNGPAHLGESAQRLAAAHTTCPAVSTTMDAIEDADLRRALEQLPEAPRLCLVLRIVGGLPYSTIAGIVGIPEGTAMSHVHRAQRALRRALIARVEGEARTGTTARPSIQGGAR